MGLDFLNEAFAGMGIGVTAVHEAVDIDFLEAIVLGYVAESEEMVERRVDASVGGEAHEVDRIA